MNEVAPSRIVASCHSTPNTLRLFTEHFLIVEQIDKKIYQKSILLTWFREEDGGQSV